MSIHRQTHTKKKKKESTKLTTCHCSRVSFFLAEMRKPCIRLCCRKPGLNMSDFTQETIGTFANASIKLTSLSILRQCHICSWLSDSAAWRLFRFRIIRAVVGTTASVRYFVIHSCPRSIGTSISRARHAKRDRNKARPDYFPVICSFVIWAIHPGILSLVDPDMHRASFSVVTSKNAVIPSVCSLRIRVHCDPPGFRFFFFLFFFLQARYTDSQ